MGNIKIADTIRIPLTIDICPYLRDHRFLDKAILPAVESMRLMAASVSSFRAQVDTRLFINAKFIKFLYLQPQEEKIEAFTEVERTTDGMIAARLITKHRSPKSGFTRTKEHAVVHFIDSFQTPEPPDPFELIKPDKACVTVSAEKIYRELVPFGPSYHNLSGDLTLFKKGAGATIQTPDYSSASGPLGSPFALDAAFHAACVWGQRFTGIVGFPVGFDKRLILQPTRPGQTYHCQIVPIRISQDLIKFNIFIYKGENDLFEFIQGVEMRDVSAGKLTPPAWIQEGAPGF